MYEFHSNVHFQRQVVRDRHQQIRREFGATRTFRDSRDRRRNRARPGPSR
jgi:hypothetical protein